jgi:hypothetical protein
MFVATGPIEDGDPAYLRWAELKRMLETKRWDVEPEAYRGHTTIAGKPFYAARTPRESLADWERRVSEDLFAVHDQFTHQGLTPHALAVPFGDYGQRTPGAPIPRLFSALATRQFGTFFVEAGDADFAGPGSGAAERFELRAGTSLADLYGWLRKHSSPTPPR